MDDDATRWDERYRDASPSEPRPPDVIVDRPDVHKHLPAPGDALDIACGTGGQSLWLAELGHRVIGLDVSPVAIETGRASVRRAGLRDRVELRTVDLDAGLPDEIGSFDVVVCQRFRHRDLYRPMIDALRPGGLAIVTVLSAVGLESEPGPFHAPPGELLAEFSRPDTDVLLHVEADATASIVIRRH